MFPFRWGKMEAEPALPCQELISVASEMGLLGEADSRSRILS